METTEEITTIASPVSTFRRVLVGVDDSPESLEAARQAAVLAEGPLTLLCAYSLARALVGGTGPGVPAYLDEESQRHEAEEALEHAERELGDVPFTARITAGRPWDALLAEIERWDDTLVVVGSHGTGRTLGIVIGSTATALIHKARCSVLIARASLGAFPRKVVVGLDGSPESAAAYATAASVADRFGAELIPIVGTVGEEVDPAAIARRIGRPVQAVEDHPVSALVSESADADLVVVGSRGLQGLKALGSVSERVAHQAASSVLIVR
ncbi:MAG TPA: universal stress protein [Gaiellaceae bacterium]|nr:universal stress protein [Gaiellaceae bacterium]